jgi:hypothetical protein
MNGNFKSAAIAFLTSCLGSAWSGAEVAGADQPPTLSFPTNPDNSKPFPSDAALLLIFHKHRDSLDRLREMASEDLDKSSYFSLQSLRDTLSLPRKDEYRTLLSAIDPSVKITVDYNKIVRFIFVLHGSSAIGPDTLKGIEFAPDGARSGGTIVEHLDSPDALADGVYLRPIDSGWFLLVQKDD